MTSASLLACKAFPFAEADEEMHELSWLGTRYACRVLIPRGTPASEPLLIIGGVLQDMHSWPRLERRLAGHQAIVFVELPGVGNSQSLPDEFTWEDLTEAAVHAMDALRILRFNVMGGSAGAPIAYRVARQHPDRTTRLVLIGATPRLSPRVSDLVKAGQRRFDRLYRPGVPPVDDATHEESARQVVELLMNTTAAAEVSQSRMVSRMLHRQLLEFPRQALLRFADYHQRLIIDRELLPPGGIQGVKALVLTGEHDQASPPDQGRAVAATITGSTFLLMKNADHLVHIEREAEFADLISRFLTDAPLDALPYCTLPEHLAEPGGTARARRPPAATCAPPGNPSAEPTVDGSVR
ncbi:alpha/beta fold hydrolase [Streptomyces sp. NPDC059828]|uniref:alpha/beta fold hydrolase n=1 Tax=Streptomyces sp. NPDC059828 TaxID=3346965 RepID=UPI0036499434